MQLIDNINSLFGDDLKKTLLPKSKLKIAASCFSMYAYEALRKELKHIEYLEFIFTSPTFIPHDFISHAVADNIHKERREFYIPKTDRERKLYGSEFEIHLRNQLTQKAIARECAAWIRKKARFRSNTSKAHMQQFACVQHDAACTAYMPLQGFTAVDLGYQPSDAVSNIMNRLDHAPIAGTYLQLFDTIWNDAEKLHDVTEELCRHMESVYEENSPERVYFLMLYHIFHEFLTDISEDVLPNDKTGYQESLIWQKLFNFQKDAAIGIINKLETYNGCILADSVGLGKTFTALAVIKYYELRNRAVLVLCPKKLADNWLTYNRNLVTNILQKDRLNYDVLCHTDLSRTSGESLGIPLDRVNWGNYDLVVIDESHNFRNNDTLAERETRYQKLMRKVIKEGVQTKVLMLSATPVNSRFNDLRNQLALAYEGDSSLLSKKLRFSGTSNNIDAIFRRAQRAFNAWTALPPTERTAKAILGSLDFDFFELLDSVTIARSRKHIQTFYDTSAIGTFPERLPPLSYHCPLSLRKDESDFNAIFTKLSCLTLAIYAPISYVHPSRRKKYDDLYDKELSGHGRLRQVDRERSLQALMTINLLKRLESSVAAFRITLERLRSNHTVTLTQIENYLTSGQGSITDSTGRFMVDTDTVLLLGDDTHAEQDPSHVIGTKIKIHLADMDINSWEESLRADAHILDTLLEAMHKVDAKNDAKLQHLQERIFAKIHNPINADNKKVLIFTAFADTASYLYEHLAPLLRKDNIHSARVTGKSAPVSTLKKGYDFQSILTLFAPKAKEKDLILPQEKAEIDVLIATDCISEGQNLQDCDYVVNYDIHWNPVRIIQRFGRIDRIGSPNACIQLVNYWPDISLDDYINLKERVENRMIIADVTATADDNVLENPAAQKDHDRDYRKEQLRKLQNEVIELEDVKTGVSITDLGLNDFRMDLLHYMKEHGDLRLTPKGLHAVVPADTTRGLLPGVIFALRHRNESVAVSRQNRLHPFYLVYIGHNAQIIIDHTEVKKLLDLVRIACKGQNLPLPDVCRLFNEYTDEGRNMHLYSNLLGSAIQSMIQVEKEKDVDSLFSGGKTSALVKMFSGLADFELIAFIIIQETDSEYEPVPF